ncbi:hypothetical protein PMAYCL1PPCAC_00276, partial [Pristionchus mayeri]
LGRLIRAHDRLLEQLLESDWIGGAAASRVSGGNEEDLHSIEAHRHQLARAHALHALHQRVPVDHVAEARDGKWSVRIRSIDPARIRFSSLSSGR